jgi:hypothetical protein
MLFILRAKNKRDRWSGQVRRHFILPARNEFELQHFKYVALVSSAGRISWWSHAKE